MDSVEERMQCTQLQQMHPAACEQEKIKPDPTPGQLATNGFHNGFGGVLAR